MHRTLIVVAIVVIAAFAAVAWPDLKPRFERLIGGSEPQMPAETAAVPGPGGPGEREPGTPDSSAAAAQGEGQPGEISAEATGTEPASPVADTGQVTAATSLAQGEAGAGTGPRTDAQETSGARSAAEADPPTTGSADTAAPAEAAQGPTPGSGTDASGAGASATAMSSPTTEPDTAESAARTDEPAQDTEAAAMSSSSPQTPADAAADGVRAPTPTAADSGVPTDSDVTASVDAQTVEAMKAEVPPADEDPAVATAATAPAVASRPAPEAREAMARQPEARRGEPRVSVVDSGTLRADGKTITLAGVEPLPADATCLSPSGRTWSCGQAAAAALANFIRGRRISCTTIDSDGASVPARCSVEGTDLASWVVGNGWGRASAGATRLQWLEQAAAAAGLGINQADRP